MMNKGVPGNSEIKLKTSTKPLSSEGKENIEGERTIFCFPSILE